MCEIDNMVGSLQVCSLTQKEYEELPVKEDNVCYYITDIPHSLLYIDESQIWKQNSDIVNIASYPKQKILKSNYCNGCGAPIILNYDKCLYCDLPVLYDYV